MHQETIILVLLFFLVGSVFTVSSLMQRQIFKLRALDAKMDALLKQQGVEVRGLSAEVQALALDPRRKIAAIKLHREEHPELGLAEAKAEIEAFAARSK